MTTRDWIGFIGVSIGISISLVAYFINLKDIIGKKRKLYLILNLFGAVIAFLFSFLLTSLPFIIFQGWLTIVSAIGLLNYFKKKN